MNNSDWQWCWFHISFLIAHLSVKYIAANENPHMQTLSRESGSGKLTASHWVRQRLLSHSHISSSWGSLSDTRTHTHHSVQNNAERMTIDDVSRPLKRLVAVQFHITSVQAYNTASLYSIQSTFCPPSPSSSCTGTHFEESCTLQPNTTPSRKTVTPWSTPTTCVDLVDPDRLGACLSGFSGKGKGRWAGEEGVGVGSLDSAFQQRDNGPLTKKTRWSGPTHDSSMAGTIVSPLGFPPDAPCKILFHRWRVLSSVWRTKSRAIA